LAQNIKFRDVWYFVGQKGIKGYTPFEKVSLVQSCDFKVCLGVCQSCWKKE